MTILDDVTRLVERLAPEPICDDCITDTLGLSVQQHADHKTHEIAGMNGFERRKHICSICGCVKPVIRKVLKAKRTGGR